MPVQDLTDIDDDLEEISDRIDKVRIKIDSIGDEDDRDDRIAKADKIMETLLRMDAEHRWDERSVRDLMDAVREWKGIP